MYKGPIDPPKPIKGSCNTVDFVLYEVRMLLERQDYMMRHLGVLPKLPRKAKKGSK